MQFQDFMRYTDIACHYALMSRFEWKGRNSPRQQQNLIQKVIFKMACINLLYFNISLCVYCYYLDRKSMDLLKYVADISDAGSMLGFTVLGTCNMFVLLIYRPQIEEVLAELQDLFDKRGKYNSEASYYLEKTKLMTKKFTMFYIISNFYYNAFPLLVMAYEFFSESQELSYRIQTVSWYPWKTLGSMPGFCASYISQIFSSAQNIGFMMANQFLINVFTAQLELHFDDLANQVENLDASDFRAKKKLKSLIFYHQRLLLLADNINRIFNFTFLISLITSTMAIFSMAFNLTTLSFVTAIKYSLGVGLFMIYTFSICHNGTQLTLASGKVMPAAFYNNWYEGDLAYRKMLLILMMRSTKPYMWRTYKLAPVSITTYMATLKFSYQMFTCVRSMK
ncbi:hypothetical protein KR200_006143 [Drosophila serrata]|nr:hypothetical protein KR200_006143 [Drosophila serrata]